MSRSHNDHIGYDVNRNDVRLRVSTSTHVGQDTFSHLNTITLSDIHQFS